jgi:hypothetical protein
MFRNLSSRRSSIRKIGIFSFVAALLISPCIVLGQRGGHPGASSPVGGIDSVGKPTGVDQKDDLKDFHQALAVQATSQQISEYAAMVKSTAAAGSELRAFLERLDKHDDLPALVTRHAALEQALEKARTANKNFLEGFSAQQKNGLKEITKKLIKADSDLAQHSEELNQKVADAKAVSEVIAGSAQGLEHALTSFQSQQASLGQEMSIADPGSQDFTFNIAPVKSSVNFHSQEVAIVTSGVITKGAEGEQSTFAIKLTEDISDLQQNITDVLRAQLDKAERCGERIAIQNANLTPAPPATLVFAQLHFERWSCFGGANNEIAEGDGTLEMKVTPAVGEDGTLRIVPAMGRINAEGLLGESLRSGSLGSELRDKITESILSAVRQGGDFKVLLPPAAQGYAMLRHAQFQSTGAGVLLVKLDGDIRVSNEKATSLTSELKQRASSQETSAQQNMPR